MRLPSPLIACCLALAACSSPVPSSPPGDPGGDPGGDAGGDGGGDAAGDAGGDPGQSGTTTEFGRCVLATDCPAGLTCTPWPDQTSTASYCLRRCPPASSSCPSAQRCSLADTADGDWRCLTRVEYFQPCDAYFQACTDDALCFGLNPAAPARCLPICALGDLPATQYRKYEPTVAGPCPSFPLGFPASPSSCHLGLVDTDTSVGLCAVEVGVGQPCDDSGLRCNPGFVRPGTDPAADPGTPDAFGFVVGQLSCVPHGGELRCERICHDPGSSFTDTMCGCPAGEPLCASVQDPGLGLDVWYACQHWADLPDQVDGCMPVEDCTADAQVCADDTTSGWLACKANPYLVRADAPASICQPN